MCSWLVSGIWKVSFEEETGEDANEEDQNNQNLSENQTEEQLNFISESALDLENFGNPSQLIENPSGLSKNCVCQNGFELPPKYCKEENANQCLYCDFGYSLTNSRNCVKGRVLEETIMWLTDCSFFSCKNRNRHFF